MSCRELVKNLNALFEFLHKMYEINCGGCCYVAYLIAKRLEDRYIDFSLRIYDYDLDYTDEELYDAIKSKKDVYPIKSNTASHYSIITKFGEINPDADSNSDYFHVDVPGINSKDLQYIYKTGNWNISYNTTNSIFVTKFIDILFKQFDNERSKM